MPKDAVGEGVSGLFDLPAKVAVERGLAEFRAGRPVVFVAQERVVAVPVDALDRERFRSFAGAFVRNASPLRLAITARRARALGIEAEGPVALRLEGGESLEGILSLAADAAPRRMLASAAGEAAVAAIELAKLAQHLPALLIAEVDPGREWGNSASLLEVEAAAVARFRNALVGSVRIAAASRVPLDGAEQAQFIVFRDAIGDSQAAIVIGEPDFSQPALVRLHSACLTGDVFGSRRCDCGDQLKLAIERVKKVGGVILYLDQEGRGLGLANKMRAYRLQDCGLDTVDANVTLGFEDDERDYGIAARMLELLGCRRVVLLTNNPAKLNGLAAAGIEVCGCVPLHAPVNAENRRYLTAKAVRAGHRLDHLWEA
jgi:GTP cyclohydrolase II